MATVKAAERTARADRVYARIVEVVVVERRAANRADLRDVDIGRQALTLALEDLVAAGRLRSLVAWGHDTGPCDRQRHVYVPSNPMLARGIGVCATPGCGTPPALIVAGHALCRDCARGPVDRERGGGQFRDPRAEANTATILAGERLSSVGCSGGWEPADGCELAAPVTKKRNTHIDNRNRPVLHSPVDARMESAKRENYNGTGTVRVSDAASADARPVADHGSGRVSPGASREPGADDPPSGGGSEHVEGAGGAPER